MKLEIRSPEDTLKPERLTEYERFRKDIHDPLVILRNTLFVLGQIARFPFEHLVSPDKMYFWFLMYWNSVDYLHILLHGLICDTGPDTNNLNRFKNLVLKEWIREEYKKDFQILLKEVKLDGELRQIAETVREIRTHSLAHSVSGKLPQLPDASRRRVKVEALQKLCEGLERMFDACCFGRRLYTLFLHYHPGTTAGDERQPTDIEELLDLVARHSYMINMPEQDPCWEVTREKPLRGSGRGHE
jgi:hypothetical protein